MGLDTVELVMAIEDEFWIQIQNKDAARLAVIGDLYDYVIEALKQHGDTPDEPQSWERFRAVVISRLGVRPEQVVRSAHIVYDLHAD